MSSTSSFAPHSAVLCCVLLLLLLSYSAQKIFQFSMLQISMFFFLFEANRNWNRKKLRDLLQSDMSPIFRFIFLPKQELSWVEAAGSSCKNDNEIHTITQVSHSLSSRCLSFRLLSYLFALFSHDVLKRLITQYFSERWKCFYFFRITGSMNCFITVRDEVTILVFRFIYFVMQKSLF